MALYFIKYDKFNILVCFSFEPKISITILEQKVLVIVSNNKKSNSNNNNYKKQSGLVPATG